MNFAFPTLLIFLFLLPGLFFSLAFYNTETKPINYIPLTHKAAISFFVTLVLHIVWISLVYFFSSYHINFHKLLILISGVQGNLYTSVVNSIVSSDIIGLTIYMITIFLAAYLIGKLLRSGIKKCKLDRTIKIFRLESPWYYLFKGYDWEIGEPDLVIITAAMEFAGKGYLYNGYLENYFLDEAGNIDRIALTNTRRRTIENDKANPNDDSFEDRFYPIDGDNFILKYAEIKSLNIQFIKLEEIS